MPSTFMGGYVYMLANRKNGALYLGVTADLLRRLHQHKTDPQGFVRQYSTDRLVWYEQHDRIEDAIQRETSLKRWKRAWKIDLIEATNPDWDDLSLTFTA
jgi:putative endonuclease